MLQLLQNLKIGQHSKPIKKDNSFFIFFLNDKRKISNFDKKNLDELKKK